MYHVQADMMDPTETLTKLFRALDITLNSETEDDERGGG
jgi:hypothetical protein